MSVEIGTEAAQFPEKEYINGIFVAVWCCWQLQQYLLAYTFKWALGKNHYIYECRQKPNRIQQDMKKLLVADIFSFFDCVVDTDNWPFENLRELFVKFSKWPQRDTKRPGGNLFMIKKNWTRKSHVSLHLRNQK